MVGQATLDTPARNAATLREGYEAFAQGDLAGAMKQFDPGIKWHLLRPGPLGGDYVGTEQVQGFFKQLAALSGGTFHMEVIDILTSGNGEAADVRVIARRGDKTLDSHQVHLFQLRDERIVEVWQFVDDATANAEFWR